MKNQCIGHLFKHKSINVCVITQRKRLRLTYKIKWVKCNVASLALGLRPKQGLAKVRAKCEGQESHFMLPGMWESVKEWTPTLLSELPLWELDSQWTSKFSKSNCRGQNPLDWKVPYIIGKFLECRCLKWVRMTHLNISNTSYA